MSQRSPKRNVVKLPCSSSRLAKPFAHVKLIQNIRPQIDSGIAFEGKICRPGAIIPAEELTTTGMVLECAGPVGTGFRRHQRDILWILWKYDWERGVWSEIARAQSVGPEWVQALREAAIRALKPEAEDLRDAIAYWQGLTRAIMEGIDRKLEKEQTEIKVNVLSAVYNQVAGRIAQQLTAA